MTSTELGLADAASRIVVAAEPRMMAELVGHRLDAQPDLSVIRVIWAREDLLPAIAEERPRLVVVDLHLMAGDVGAVCRRIRELQPGARLVILTSGSGDGAVMEAVEAGCTSFAVTNTSDADLVAAGLNNAEVAERLGLSVNTVRHHVQSILSRLGVHTKLQAVTLALRQGLISPEAR